MNAFEWAAFATLLAYTLASFVMHWRSGRASRADAEMIDELCAQRDEDGRLIAQLYRDVQMGEVGMSDLLTRLKRMSDDLAETQRQAGLAARAGMEIAIRERSTGVARITAERREWAQERWRWTELVLTACRLLGQRQPLPAAGPKPPLALPRGAGFLVEPDLLLPADDEDAGSKYWAEPLPAGTNGTRP